MSANLKFIAYLAIYISIIILMSIVPFLGYIQIGPIAFTTIPIVIAIATIHLGFYGAITSSVFFGLFSFVHGLMYSSIFISFPDSLIIPRIILGFFVYLFYLLIKPNKLWKFTIFSFCTITLNTILFTLYIYLNAAIGREFISDSFYGWIILIYVNFIVELSIAIGLSVLIFPILYAIIKNTKINKSIFW